MSEHQPDGTHVAIHSIVVHPSLQRQGVALALLKAYLERLRANPKYHSAVLISHDNLIPLYQKAGFQLRGKSDVVHGSEPWYELAADVSSPASSSVAPAAAQVASPGKSLQQVGKDQLLCNEHGKNQFALYCPRGACKCLLLRANSAVQVERTKQPVSCLPHLPLLDHAHADHHVHEQFLDPIAKPTPCPPDFPPPDDPSTSDIPYWSVQPPSAMTFENIGFSKSLGSIKFLTCADCDCGPLGWHDTQGADLARDVESSINAVNRGQEGGGQAVTTKEFLLDLRRVRYQV